MRVLISGAGAHITIVEKCRSISSSGHNVDVNHSAISVMKKMGLIDQLRRFNTTEKGTQFVDPNGRPFAPFPVKEGSSSSPTSEFEILRGDLATVLYEETKDHPNIEYLFGMTCSEVVSNDGDIIKIGLSNGQVRDFDLVVAADGQWSKIRKLGFPRDSITVIDKDMYVVYSAIPRIHSDNDWWNIYQALGSRVITLRPDPHGTIRAMLTRMPCNDAQKRTWQGVSRGGRKLQQELVRREFRDAGWQAPRILGAVEQSEDYYFQEIKQIKMSKLYSARVVCLGDAAFAPTPLSGMGTSLAIIGGYMLAGELSKLGKGENPLKALEAYEIAFRPYVEETQKIPWIVPGIVHPVTPWKRWLFRACVSSLSKIVAMPWVAKRFSNDTNVDDSEFPLPVYPKLADKSSK
ncbi:2-polyprenyl-6-methoxyphenol hydroxylase-like oxidoreductase protein [Colletotrichum incanum]|uniref:2-polyprenyl-6-methoxyphenol hydroxylase-like oxidoreductase protein n=1 Tax=Colletotrichum incanum TaxID=1573173 RepID=A0A167EJE5_COLIC|nr:2-polyprenyl-6-methoxyphenol hydroxylase-like oxidoreductase protein [Colletotrichum incanum]